MAAAGGFTGGHALYPRLELGAAYDHVIQTLVFDPLGMTSTTFDSARALRGPHAMPHGIDIDGVPARDAMTQNYAFVPMRPAGAAWSNIDDLLKYLAMAAAPEVAALRKTLIVPADPAAVARLAAVYHNAALGELCVRGKTLFDFGELISEVASRRNADATISFVAIDAGCAPQLDPPGRALGALPTASTGNALVDAFFWLKSPGASDGACGTFPAAGAWLPEYALGLAQRAAS